MHDILLEALSHGCALLSAPLTKDVAEKVRQKSIKHQAPKRNEMLTETKVLLDNFYAKYNSMLADLLGDNRFLWE